MTTTLTRQHVADVAEFIDPNELKSHSGTSVTSVFLSFSNGTQIPVSDRGRELIVFILEALDSGLEVVVEAEDELLTPQAAAKMLGVTRQSVYRWQDDALLPIVMRGRSRSVPLAAVRALKAARDTRDVVREKAATLGREARDIAANPDHVSVDLVSEVRRAARERKPAGAAAAWRVARAEQVAASAARAAEAFAADAD